MSEGRKRMKREAEIMNGTESVKVITGKCYTFM
jgi:hypothetical protein